MFEDMSYKGLLERMLARVPETFDKREGAVIYDALAPAAMELQLMYLNLESILRELFADTASREYLIRRAAERGISPLPAAYAVLKGKFAPASVTIPEGARFSCGEYDYSVLEKIADGEYRLRCETLGSVGNTVFGTLIPIDYIAGLERCELTELLIPGQDEEETEHLRKRYFDSLKSQAYGGNIADYREKTATIQGVGGVKVYPAWAGGGTVKLVVISSEYQAPSDNLVQLIQEEIDPPADSGKGYGIAPIGHHVTVVPVSAANIDLKFQIVFRAEYNFTSVKEAVENAVDAYFDELNRAWADSEHLVIRISRLESRVLEIEGILDITETKLNGSAQNMILGENEIAIRGTVSEAGN